MYMKMKPFPGIASPMNQYKDTKTGMRSENCEKGWTWIAEWTYITHIMYTLKNSQRISRIALGDIKMVDFHQKVEKSLACKNKTQFKYGSLNLKRGLQD